MPVNNRLLIVPYFWLRKYYSWKLTFRVGKSVSWRGNWCRAGDLDETYLFIISSIVIDFLSSVEFCFKIYENSIVIGRKNFKKISSFEAFKMIMLSVCNINIIISLGKILLYMPWSVIFIEDIYSHSLRLIVELKTCWPFEFLTI